jgi:hypothetical protein
MQTLSLGRISFMMIRTRLALLGLLFVVIATSAFVIRRELAARVVEQQIVAAAETFLATLDDAQKTKAHRTFADADRFNWAFVPLERNGLPLKEMTLPQRNAAFALLQSALSTQGYLKATGVMGLEGILAVIENRPDYRDPENYHFWVFGTPSVSEPWAWRFEGHHISISFTSVGGLTITGPAFMGANPARVTTGSYTGFRVLAAEEDLGRTLVTSLNAAQRERAILAPNAPNDIVTMTQREAMIDPIAGIPYSALDAEQKVMFLRLLDEYLGNFEPAHAADRRARIEVVGLDQLHFVWLGSLDVGARHYYRIHGPTILIEYDNTQNNANHIHSVVRDLENDFGGDLLRRHYETATADHGHDLAGTEHSHDEVVHTH